MARGGLREGIGTATTVRPTSRSSSPRLALLAPAAERERSPHGRRQLVDRTAWDRRHETALPGVLLVLVLFLAPAATDAQSVPKPWRLGYLAAAVGGPAPHEALRGALCDLGYVEGQNLVVETRFADAKFERLPQLALELVKLGPDAIVAVRSA